MKTLSQPFAIQVQSTQLGTRIPPNTSFTNSAGVWTLNANTDIELNGVYVNGRGTILDCGADLIVYTLGTDNPANWYQWRGGSDWAFLGPVDPRDDPSVLLPAPILTPPPSDFATPFVVHGVAYSTLQEAHDAPTTVNGDTIKVVYGVYTGFSAFSAGSPRLLCTKNGLTIEWQTAGLIPSFDYGPVGIGDTNVGGGGTAIEMEPSCTSLTIRGIEIIGANIANAPAHVFLNVTSGYPGNVTPYTATLEYCSLKKWTNGILTGPNTGGVVNLRYCLIENCGGGDGMSHGIYVSDISTLNVVGCTFRTTVGGVPSGSDGTGLGHLFKSRARFGTLDANIFDGVGGCSRPLDICNGGTYTLRGCFIHKHVDTAPGQCIRFGAEQRDGQPTFIFDGRVHALAIEQCTLKNDTGTNVLLVDAVTNGTSVPVPVTKTVRNNVAAGQFATDITQFPNNSEVALTNINADGRLTIAEIIGTQNDATKEYAGLFIAPTPRTDSCCGSFEESVVAGNVPSWLSGPVNQWTDVPGSRPSDYLKNDGTGILPAAFMAGSGNQEPNYRQCDSYGGPCWSEKNKELYRFGGGHAATNLNPLVKAQLNLESPKWVTVDLGSSATTIQSDWDSGSWDASAYHTDGRLKSTHAYRGNHSLDNGEFLQVACGAGNSPTAGHLDLPDVAGFANGAWRPKGYWQSLPVEGQGYTETVQCTDPNGNGVYLINLGNPLRRLDGTTRQFSQIGGDYHSWMGGNSDCTKMGAKAGQICAITFVGDVTSPYSLRYIDTSTGAETPLTLTGAAFPLRTDGWRPVEIVWADAVNKWYVAFNQDDGNFGSSAWPLYSITPTSVSAATVALVGATGAPPTSGVRRGLYYSRDWKCLIAYNGWASAVKVLRVA